MNNESIVIRDQPPGKGNGKENILPYPAYYINNIDIKDDDLFFNKINILKNIKIVIFDYNEVLCQISKKDRDNIKHKFILISRIIKKHNKILFNDPELGYLLGDKFISYELLRELPSSSIFKLPKVYSNSSKNINFPIICREKVNTHSSNDFIASNFGQFKNLFKKKCDYVVTEYIDSFNKNYNVYHSIRLMVVNEKLIDFYYRPSHKSIIHNNDQIKDIRLIQETDKFFKNYLNSSKLSDSLNDLYKILGNGFYSIDCILNEGSLYICEIGYKFYDITYVNFTKSIDGLILNKPSLNKTRLKILHEKIIKSVIDN